MMQGFTNPKKKKIENLLPHADKIYRKKIFTIQMISPGDHVHIQTFLVSTVHFPRCIYQLWHFKQPIHMKSECKNYNIS
jgi:hypothetical protein